MTTATQPAHFRTPILRGQELQGVDRKAGVIRGAKIMQVGPLNDSRPWDVDSETLDQLEEFAGRRNKGLKARFTHPGMSDDGLGTFVGHWRNLRRINAGTDQEATIGDLHISQTAKQTPKHGDLANYLMDMAEQEPEEFGVSAATKLAESMYDDDSDEERLPLRFADIHAADFVDSPAATRGGLFSVDFSDPKDLPSLFEFVVDQHFSELDPVAILSKAHRFLERKFGTPIQFTTEDSVSDPDDDPDPPAAGPPAADPPADPGGDHGQATGTVDLSQVARFREAFGDTLGPVWLCEGLSFEQAQQRHGDELQKENEQLRGQVADLKNQLDTLMGEVGPLDVGKPAGPRDGDTGTTTIRQAIRKKE